jgi:hypothetical protein
MAVVVIMNSHFRGYMYTFHDFRAPCVRIFHSLREAVGLDSLSILRTPMS